MTIQDVRPKYIEIQSPIRYLSLEQLSGDSTSRALHFFSNLEDKKWAYKKSMRELLILLIESESQHIELQDKICC